MNVRDEFHRNMQVTGHDKMASAILTLAGALQSMEVQLKSHRDEPVHVNVGTDRATNAVKIGH